MGFGPALYAQRRYAQIDYSESPYNVALADSLTGSEAPALGLQRPLADSVSNSDAFGVLELVLLADTLAAPTDAQILSMTAVLAESLASGDTLSSAISALLSESVSSSDGTAAGISLALAETLVAVTDALGVSAQANLVDGVLADDVISSAIAGALADTIASSETLARTINYFFSESLGLTDQMGPNTQRSPISDFLLIKEFISIRLARLQGWAEGGTANRGIVPHLYGRALYAQTLYSTNTTILWQAVQAQVMPAWQSGPTQSRTVRPHIYGNVLYAQNMYSTNIAILWKAIQRSTGPGFTNDDGHKYNS